MRRACALPCCWTSLTSQVAACSLHAHHLLASLRHDSLCSSPFALVLRFFMYGSCRQDNILGMQATQYCTVPPSNAENGVQAMGSRTRERAQCSWSCAPPTASRWWSTAAPRASCRSTRAASARRGARAPRWPLRAWQFMQTWARHCVQVCGLRSVHFAQQCWPSACGVSRSPRGWCLACVHATKAAPPS